ncbi:MAG: flagellar hook-basal body complex protein FliE [Planctomycetaceae bacterium]|nr:flagellar hook-basal body complex protein FliE [Planctomycetaceae bacterium]
MNVSSLPAGHTPMEFLSNGAVRSPSSAPFAELVGDLVQGVNQQQQTVAIDVHQLAAGESDNLQEIAVHVAQADLSFRFLMEVRDKLITGYQEIMRMQI